MERRLVRTTNAVRRFSLAFDNYEAIKDDITALNSYYGSKEWRQDLADDDAGLLPEGLKRGVLSEDGIWNLLTDYHELQKRITKLK